MQAKQVGKIIILNLAIVVANVTAFSEGLLNWSLTSVYAPERAAGLTLVIMSALVFLYGNYRLLTRKASILDYDADELDEREEFVKALKEYGRRKPMFSGDVEAAIHQVERLERKERSLNEILLKNYNEGIDDMQALKEVVSDSKDLMYENVRRMMNRMSVFDQEEYERIRSAERDNEALRAKWTWFSQNISYMKNVVENNEKILLEFDRLLVEVSSGSDDDSADGESFRRIQDTVNAMGKLRSRNRTEDEAMSELERKYENE